VATIRRVWNEVCPISAAVAAPAWNGLRLPLTLACARHRRGRENRGRQLSWKHPLRRRRHWTTSRRKAIPATGTSSSDWYNCHYTARWRLIDLRPSPRPIYRRNQFNPLQVFTAIQPPSLNCIWISRTAKGSGFQRYVAIPKMAKTKSKFCRYQKVDFNFYPVLSARSCLKIFALALWLSMGAN